MIRHFLWLPAATLGLLVSLSAPAMELKMDSLTIGSTIYTNVVIISVDPADVYFQHKDGMANVKLRQLDPRIRRKFNFDPERAILTEQQQAIDNAQYSRDSAVAFAHRVTQERAAAAARDAAGKAPFTLVDPASPASPLNRAAPPIDLKKWFSAKPPRLAGKFGLIFFWRSNSQPCRAVLATFNELSKAHPDEMVVIGVTPETESELKPLDTAVDFYSGSDPEGRYTALFGIQSVPAVAVIDPKGILRYAGHPAALTEETLSRLIAQYSTP